MAHRERAINNLTQRFIKQNGVKPNPVEKKAIQEEATIVAREGNIDFAQGGNYSKMLDSGIPYLNASIQGTRVFLRNWKNDPAGVTVKMAQLVGVSALLWNINSQHPGWSQVSDREKEANFIMFVPDWLPGVTSHTNDKGEKIYRYVKVAKEQQQRIFSTAIDAVFEWKDTGKIPKKQVFQALGEIVPPALLNNPMVAASVAMGNLDTYTFEEIWKGRDDRSQAEEIIPGKTSLTMQKVGEVTGLSPERTGRVIGKIFPDSNPISMLISGGVKTATGELKEEVNKKGWSQFVSENRGIQRIFGSTNPYADFSESMKEDKAQVADVHAKQNREFDKLSEEVFRKRDRSSLNAMIAYVEKQDEKTQERLQKRYERDSKLVDIPDRSFWKAMLDTKSPEVRARQLIKRIKKLPPEQRQRFVEVANSIEGIITDDTLQYLERLQ